MLWQITDLARFVKLQGKTFILEFSFGKVVGQKSFSECFLTNFTKVFWIVQKRNNIYKELLLDQNDHFHCQILTNHNWNQCQNQCPTTSIFFLQEKDSVIALGLRRLVIDCEDQLQSNHWEMRVTISSSRFKLDKRGSHFCISLVIECTQ